MDEVERWHATFGGQGLPNCHIRVDSNSGNKRLRVGVRRGAWPSNTLIDLQDPFEAAKPEIGRDRRIGVIVELCQDLINRGERSYNWYRRSLDLWGQVENWRAE